jgi:inorganic pyrophosphatase
MNFKFWYHADKLVASSQIVIDRPKGSQHPVHAEIVYPLDYGYLDATTGGDGKGVDVWVGSLKKRQVTGAIITVDLQKRDSEVKLLIDCTPEEGEAALQVHQTGDQGAQLVWRNQQG